MPRAAGNYFRNILIAVLIGTAVFPCFAQKSSSPIDQVLQDAVDQKKIPGVVAMVAIGDKITYQGAFGNRDTTNKLPMTMD